MPVAEKKIIFTYDDLLNWEEDKFRHELIEGEHFMTPSPSVYHQKISINLSWRLKDYIDANNLGIVLAAPTDVKLSDIDLLVPDIFFVRASRLHILKEKYLCEAPDLVIEILSPSTSKRDKDLKFKRYTHYGVLEYWIVDPQKQSIDVYNLEEQKLIAVFTIDQKLNSPMFPDIQLELQKIF